MGHADVLRQAVEAMVQAASPFRQAMVAAVHATTVDLDWGAGRIEDVPCASSYVGRSVGDKVWVIRSPAGNWEVLTRSEVVDPGLVASTTKTTTTGAAASTGDVLVDPTAYASGVAFTPVGGLMSNNVQAALAEIMAGLPLIQRGTQPCTSPTANTTVQVPVSFPKPYTSVPTVMVSADTGFPERVELGAYDIAMGGFTITHNRTTTATTSVNWLAVGS